MPTNGMCTTLNCPRKRHAQTPMGETDHLISARRPDLNNNQQRKEHLQNCRLSCPGRAQNKTERMWKERYVPRPCYRIEKTMKHEGDNHTNCDWCLGTVTKGLLKVLEDLEIGEWRPSKQQHYWKRPEYRDKTCRLQETCCHSISRERPSAYADVKNSNE